LEKQIDGSYLPTSHLISLIDKGILIVFDEISALKNVNCQTRKAAHAMIKALISRNTSSRALLLSALPCNEPVHVLSLMQLLGVISDDKFYDYNKRDGIYRPLGVQEAINWCYHKKPEITQTIVNEHPPTNKRNLGKLGMELYRQVVSSELSSCIKLTIPEHLDVKNGYYPIDSTNLLLMKEGQKILYDAVRYRDDFGQGGRSIDWGKITTGLELLGRSKLTIIVQLATVMLLSDPNLKIVIGVWFISHIKWLAEALKQYGVVTLFGGVAIKDRIGVIDQFQAPDTTCRIMIINPTVGGMGISLDDQHGQYPRLMLLIPDYRLMDLVQCLGRVHRNSTQSKKQTMVRYIYANEFSNENKILASLTRKSEDARIVVSDQSGIILPDSFPVDTEIKSLPEIIGLPPLPVRETLETNVMDTIPEKLQLLEI
jgi:SNF2 family DNA or RNA helicase